MLFNKGQDFLTSIDILKDILFTYYYIIITFLFDMVREIVEYFDNISWKTRN